MVNDDAPLTSTLGLSAGDVCLVAVNLIDRTTGNPFWWKRWTCVLEAPHNSRYVDLLTLKMDVDIDKDVRTVDVTKDVVTRLPEARWPQGVVAMRMKWIAKGLIKLT